MRRRRRSARPSRRDASPSGPWPGWLRRSFSRSQRAWFGVNAYRQSRIAETATKSAVEASKDANRERDNAVQARKRPTTARPACCRNRGRWRFSRKRRAPKATSRRRCCWRWRRCQSRGSATESPVFIARCPTKRRPPCIRRGSGTARRRSPAITARFAVAAFSPDGTHVVTASDDKTARVWDLREKQPSFVALEGHQGRVDRRRSARTEPMSSPRPLTRRRGCGTCARSSRASSPSKAIRVRSMSAAFSPDGTHVVTASMDKTARVWDLREKQPSFVALEGHQGRVNSAAFSPDGTHVVTASEDKTARVWDLREKQPSFVALEGHQGPVSRAAFSPDGTHVVTASSDKTARVWDLREKQPSFVALEGHQGPVTSAAFSPDGTHVVTASDDKTARVWDLRDEAAELRRPRRPSGCGRCRRRSARTEPMSSRRPMTRRRGCGTCARSSRASSPSKAISGPSLGGVVQPGRNPCRHRVMGQDGAGVGPAGQKSRAFVALEGHQRSRS